MSYLREITLEDVVNALNEFILSNENINTKGRSWILVYNGYTFSPNPVIRKVGKMKKVQNLHGFEGGIGPNGCITHLLQLGFELRNFRKPN